MSMADNVLDSMNSRDPDGDCVEELGGAWKSTKAGID